MTKEEEEKNLKALLHYREQNKLLKEQVEFHRNHYLITKYTALRYKYIGLIAHANGNKSTSTEEVRRPESTSDTK